MQFILNVGNTHAVLGDHRGTPIRRLPSTQLNTDVFAEISVTDSIFAGCVVPDLKAVLANRFGDRVRFLDWRQLSTPDFSNVAAATMGADRVANAVMLTQGPLPALCVDFGTAIHAVAVDANRTVVGGFILPGRQLMRNALAAGTAQLPLVDTSLGDTQTLGRDTPTAIAAGVDEGSRGAVRHLVRKSIVLLGKSTRIVLAGGDAPWFADSIPEAEVCGAGFTLQGLALAANSSDD